VGSRAYSDTDLHVPSDTNRWDMDVYPGLRSSSRSYHGRSPSSPTTRSSSLLEYSCQYFRGQGCSPRPYTTYSTSQVATRPLTLLPLTQEHRCAVVKLSLPGLRVSGGRCHGYHITSHHITSHHPRRRPTTNQPSPSHRRQARAGHSKDRPGPGAHHPGRRQTTNRATGDRPGPEPDTAKTGQSRTQQRQARARGAPPRR